MLGPSADIEDVTQEVFLQVHKSLGEFRGQAKFTTFMGPVQPLEEAEEPRPLSEALRDFLSSLLEDG